MSTTELGKGPLRHFASLALLLCALVQTSDLLQARQQVAVQGCTSKTVIAGRVQLPSKTPAAGIVVKLTDPVGVPENSSQAGEAQSWQEMQVLTNSNGEFEFEFVLPPVMTLSIELESKGHAAASWWMEELRSGDVRDLGELILEETGSITGRLVNAKGEVISEVWEVAAERSLDPFNDGRALVRCHVLIDTATGTFRIDGVPPGKVHVYASNPLAGWVDGPVVQLVPGQVQHVEITYSGPDLSRRITVTPTLRHSFMSVVPASAITLHAPGLEPVTAKRTPNSPIGFCFDDLDPNQRYTLMIQDSRMATWKQEGVASGSALSVEMVGSVTLRLAVVDVQKRPIDRFELTVSNHSVSFMSQFSELIDVEGLPPEERLFRGLLPGEHTLRFVAEGFETLKLALSDLKPGETRDVVAQLKPITQQAIDGAVYRHDGSPMEGAWVVLYKPALLNDSPTSPFETPWWSDEDARESRREIAATETDADGRFRLASPQSGKVIVRIIPGPGIDIVRELIVTSGSSNWIEVTCDPYAYVTGQIQLPEGATTEGIEVCVGMNSVVRRPFPGEWTLSGVWSSEDEPDAMRGELQTDGTFRVGPLPPGDGALAFIYSEQNSLGKSSERLVFNGAGFAIKGAESLHLNLDSRTHFFGKVDVAISVNGVALAGYGIRLIGDYGKFDSSTIADKPTRMLAGNGEYQLRIVSPEKRFTIYATEPVIVPPGGIGQFLFDLELIEHQVALQCEAGHPFAAGTPVHILFEDDLDKNLNDLIASNKEGEVSLAYPPGSKLRIQLGSRKPHNSRDWWKFKKYKSWPLVEWKREGPSPSTVVLKCGKAH